MCGTGELSDAHITITYNPIEEEIEQWIRFNNTDK
jgi:hypothetical protein